MSRKLVDMEITAVAGVDRAANKRKFLIIKAAGAGSPDDRKEVSNMEKPSFLKRLKEAVQKMMGMGDGTKAMTMDQMAGMREQEDELWQKEWRMREDFDSSVRSIVDDESMDMEKKKEMLHETMEQYHTKLAEHMQSMMQLMQDMKGNTGAATGDGAVSMSKTMDPALVNPPLEKKEGEDSVKTLAEFLKSLSSEDRTAAEAEIAKRVQPAKFELTEEIAKRLDAATKAATDATAKVEVLEKQAEAAEKRADAAEALAKAEQEARVSREFLEKAAKYPNAGTAVEVADILRKAYSVSKEYGEKLEETLGKTEAVMAQSKLFQEVGKAGRPVVGSATERLEKRALEVFPGKNLHAAVDEFLKTAEGSALYSESLKEGN